MQAKTLCVSYETSRKHSTIYCKFYSHFLEDSEGEKYLWKI